MARISEIEQRLRGWGELKRWGGAWADTTDFDALDKAIDALPVDLKATLAQVYLHDGVIAEHARALGCPEGTVRRRLGRADRLLCEQLYVER